ncbi:hypothetical protein F4820DRAFT_422202 [Hypoxylon rubiginosum]|uniref:Uncharacterized protein n=1 Tax=Hypoxylon rubiginosum TaxID=110542 RepID=A0ACB9Z1A2_9PEZI|nr:hypothetical protein F4820DRAFT_422202 [Hypoxylon rubiginosum]
MPKRKRPIQAHRDISTHSSVSTHDNISIQVLADEERDSIPSPLPPTDYERSLARLPNATTRNLVNKDPKRPILGAASYLNPSKDHRVADLDKYIEAAYDPYEKPSSRRPIFNQAAGHFRPQLEQRLMNRIILYTGCFNPPHRGHQEMLNRVFSCTRDINVIAAIVKPIGGQSKEYTDDVSFTRDQKIQLWTGNQGPHDWLWVYDRSSDEWEIFRDRLTRAIRRDGFHLEFVWLGGPDHVKTDDVSKEVWGCEDIIVSDVGRMADFVRPNGKLIRLTTCTPWKPVSIDRKKMVRKSTDTAEWILGSLSFTMLGKSRLTSQAVWVFFFVSDLS